MVATDPAHLDTIAFSGIDESSLKQKALSSRDGLDLFAHELSYVRRRRVGTSSSKPGIIFLPDGPATIESYDHVVEALKGDFNIAIIETPGLGYSFPIEAKAMDFEVISQIVAESIIDLDLRDVVLAGACFNGLIAARVAQIIPESLAGLIIAQTGDFKSEQKWFGDVLDPTGDLQTPFEGQVFFRLRREKATLDWWVPFSAGPTLDVDRLQREGRKVFQQGCCYGLATMLQKWGTTGMPDVPDLLQTIPTTIIWGEADKSHVDTDKHSVWRYAPEASFRMLPNIGHFPDLEAPHIFAEEARLLIAR